jgi:hypothetical protein
MRQIHALQFELVGDAHGDRFVEREIGALRERHPARLAHVPESALRELVRLGVDRAAHVGVTAARDVGRFIDCLLRFGSDLDRDPAYAWARGILAMPVDGTRKMNTLATYERVFLVPVEADEAVVPAIDAEDTPPAPTARTPDPTCTPASTIASRGTVAEAIVLEPVPLQQASVEMVKFLGPPPYTQTHPRLGTFDPTRLVSADRLRSIRRSAHERDSAAAQGSRRHHYHEETWSFDPATRSMNVADTVRRLPATASTAIVDPDRADGEAAGSIGAAFDALVSSRKAAP